VHHQATPTPQNKTIALQLDELVLVDNTNKNNDKLIKTLSSKQIFQSQCAPYIFVDVASTRSQPVLCFA
jgi:hypothetical protein